MIKLLVICSSFVVYLLLPTTNNQLPTHAMNLDEINKRVCDRFEEDLNKLAAIMDEVRARKGITETRVAFGGVDTPIKSADYQVTFAAEAIAFERVQKFSTTSQLKYSLESLKQKILRAKVEVGRAIK